VTVHHHIDDTTLLRYASGDLDEAFSVVVAAHLAMCSVCRRASRAAEEVGGRLLETGDEAEISIGAFDRLMQKLDENSDRISVATPEQAGSLNRANTVPTPLQRFIGPSLENVSWKRAAPGVRRHAIDLSSATSSSLYMLNIAPAKAVPEHGHGGAEMTLILSGAYNDELGRFGPGDIADLDEHLEHQPKVEPEEPCICLVATEAPTRFKGFFSRLFQPLVGI
jgi:putative transcriptional regulator